MRLQHGRHSRSTPTRSEARLSVKRPAIGFPFDRARSWRFSAEMLEYAMTTQAPSEGTAVEGADARQVPLHPPTGDDWELHSLVQGNNGLVAVWQRRRHSAVLSEAYEHPKG